MGKLLGGAELVLREIKHAVATKEQGGLPSIPVLPPEAVAALTPFRLAQGPYRVPGRPCSRRTAGFSRLGSARSRAFARGEARPAKRVKPGRDGSRRASPSPPSQEPRNAGPDPPHNALAISGARAASERVGAEPILGRPVARRLVERSFLSMPVRGIWTPEDLQHHRRPRRHPRPCHPRARRRRCRWVAVTRADSSLR